MKNSFGSFIQPHLFQKYKRSQQTNNCIFLDGQSNFQITSNMISGKKYVITGIYPQLSVVLKDFSIFLFCACVNFIFLMLANFVRYLTILLGCQSIMSKIYLDIINTLQYNIQDTVTRNELNQQNKNYQKHLMMFPKKISGDQNTQNEELNLEKQSYNSPTIQYFNEVIQLLVIKLVFIAKISEHQKTQLHVYKVMPENLAADLPFYMFNFITSKVNCISMILTSNKSKKSNSLFQYKLCDQDQHSFFFHEILGITDKPSIILKCNVLLYDKQINCQIIVKMMNEVYELIIESHAKLLTIDQSKDMFEIDNELNNLVEKLNNVCTLLNKVI